ncbi:MAG TPA: hypothetical protein VF582_01225, partial [Allosphingosinicella sp.]
PRSRASTRAASGSAPAFPQEVNIVPSLPASGRRLLDRLDGDGDGHFVAQHGAAALGRAVPRDGSSAA